ncbi:MAG: ABC transporter permease [Candidatus Dormibacteria bacterium]
MIHHQNSLRHEWTAFIGFFERQINLYKRYWLWEVVWLVYNIVSVLSIGYLASGLGTAHTTQARASLERTQLYLLVGAVLWGYLSLVFFEIASAVTWERWEGTIEYTFMAPIRRITHLLGVCSFGVVYGLVRTVIVLVVVTFAFHLNLTHANIASAGAIILVSTLPLIGLGILSAILPLLSPEKGEQMTVAIQGVLLLVSGVYYPISVLPRVLQDVGILSPLTGTLSGMRDALLNGASISALGTTLWHLLLMGIVLIVLGIVLFQRAEQRAKRLGLLKRNG